MSAPTKQLGKLSIGKDMTATTRSQAQSQEEAAQNDPPSDSDSDREEDSSSDEEGASSALHVQGKSTISYDIRQLSQAARARALAGLKGDFVVDVCRGHNGTFDFQIADHGRVHVGHGPLTCSCKSFQANDEACRHIFWLVDHLHRWALPRRPPPGVPLQSTGECPNFPSMVDMVGDDMEDIAKKANWPYLADAGSPVDSGPESQATTVRIDRVRDILSSFSETTMPDEFRPDLVESIDQHRTPEECVVQGDFDATMFRLAVHDDSVYMVLRRVMPSGARATIFFDKIRRKCTSLLAEFDRYCHSGTPCHDGTVPELPTVAAQFRENLRQIHKNISSRAPLGSKDAAEVLTDLLRNIANRNYDAWTNSHWGRGTPVGETEDDRNLYALLIGNTEDEFFVLDCLELLPDSVLAPWVPKLRAVFETLQANAAPTAYLRKMQLLLAGERAGSSGASAAGSSGQKRPATAGESSAGGRKRTKEQGEPPAT